MARYSGAFREKTVRAYRRSGLTQAEFAELHGVKVCTLRDWIYGRRGGGRGSSRRSKPKVSTPPKQRAVRLVPVAVRQAVGAAASAEKIEVALPTGVWLRFAVGTDCRYVAELLSATAARG